MPGADTYTLIFAAGAALPMGGIRQSAAAGGETMSLSVRSADVEADTARLKGLGATVVVASSPAADGGRLARLQDPRGTLFSVWRAPEQPAAAADSGIPRPGSLAWFEIGTADIEASKAFYTDAFGWKYVQDTGVTSLPYYAAVTPGGERGSGGLADTSAQPGAQDYAAPQFIVPDVPATVTTAKALGAKVETGPESTTYGLTFARLTDPRGIRFVLFSPPTAGAERA